MLSVYRKLYDILDSRERALTLLVFLLLLMVAFVETMGVASIMPFMAVLANPQVVETNRYLAEVYTRLGFESTDAFLFFLGVVFLILIVGSLVLRAFAFWAQLRFSHMRNHAWGTRLIAGYLCPALRLVPHAFFIPHSGRTSRPTSVD
jgi:ATP-binding cassette, subfamily B, bacterial PglK